MQTPANERINETLKAIKDSGLNYFRCILTGAPYAMIMDDEIRLAIKADMADQPDLEVDRLVDGWALRALTYSTRPCPALQASKDSLSLAAISMSGEHGSARVVTYFLTRFFFPANLFAAHKSTSDVLIARMGFSSQLYDMLTSAKLESLAEAEQRLAAADSWCELNKWNEINIFGARNSVAGIHAKANHRVRDWLTKPEAFLEELAIDSLAHLTDFLLAFICHATERSDIVIPKGSRAAQNVFSVISESVPVLMSAKERNEKHLTRAQLATMEQAAREYAKTMNDSKVTKFAWSATYGPGYIMGTEMPGRRKSQMKAPKKAKPQTKTQKNMADAISDALAGGLRLDF